MKDFYLFLNYFLTFISVVCLHLGKCIEKKTILRKLLNLTVIY